MVDFLVLLAARVFDQIVTVLEMLPSARRMMLHKRDSFDTSRQDFMPNLEDNAVNLSAFVGLCTLWVSLSHSQSRLVTSFP